MASLVELEEIIDIHPLDEVGRDINEILQIKHDEIRTDSGISYAMAIKIGEISIFMARFNGVDRDTFTVGLDIIHGDEFYPLCDDFVWSIRHPLETSDTDEDIELLKKLVRKAGSLGEISG